MADVEKYAKELSTLVEHTVEFKQKISHVCGGSFAWGMDQVVQSYLSMFDRFCPFKVGDRVVLTKAPKIPDENHGWWCCRNLLVKGATGIVKARGYSKGRFTFDVEIDNQTWVDDSGEKQPTSSSYMFCFSEDFLESEL